MTNDESAPPLYQLSDTNHAAWVVVASIIFFTYALLAVVAKVLIRFKITSLQSHDVLLIFAILLFFAQTVCVILSCNVGLGQHQDQLTADSAAQYSKVNKRP
jgi:energy-coupling factor transporter transmembrane protein EcfT